MLWNKFYKENKQLIDDNLMSLICPGAYIVGGRNKIMYKKWAWELANKMQESLIFPWLQKKPLYCWEKLDDELYRDYDYSAMERNFVHLGHLIAKHNFQLSQTT